MQILLSSPEITCEHCIATITETVRASGLGTVVSGDPEGRTFIVDIDSGAALDGLGVALAAAGYPLGPVVDVHSHDAHDHVVSTDDWHPGALRIQKTDVGANVNYDCYCGCDAGFALDRSAADPAPESCCCGNLILVGRDAGERITTKLGDPARYRLEVQTAAMPWGQPLEVVIAVPQS